MRAALVALAADALPAACGGQDQPTVDEVPTSTPTPTPTPEETEATPEETS